MHAFACLCLHLAFDSVLLGPVWEDEKERGLRAILCKYQTVWEMTNFDPPTQIYKEVRPHEGCSKMSIIEVIT